MQSNESANSLSAEPMKTWAVTPKWPCPAAGSAPSHQS